MLKELGISEIGDNLRGLTSSTKMHYNNFNISCGNPVADQLLSGNNEPKTGYEEIKNPDEDEEQSTLGYVRVAHNYLTQELHIPTLEPYRTQEIDYGDEFNLSKNNRFLTYEDKKKAYSGEEDHIFCGRFPHLSDCGCKYPCSLLLPKIHPIEVIENIYVGSLESAIKTKELLFLKIKYILNLSCVSYNKRMKYFRYYDIFINDNHTENAIKYFKITNRFIEDAVNSGGKILIHSENGTSRCWVFLMAYLIGRKHMTFNIAFDLVKSKFAHVEPNDNFLTQLKHYDLKVNI
jgi:hypothetical protein